MSKLKEILQRKKEREEKLKSSLDSVTRQLSDLGALKIILFGSLAEEDVDVFSDLDLLVIMPPEKSGKEWMRLAYENVDRGIASDIIIYNQKELQENLARSSFLRGILDSGRIVYEKTL
ncbi:MAG: nucleotidyltransferase domain-containing protein [Dehalococcoidia bacterium]